MDISDPKILEIFFDVHSNLPRQGPGSRSCTQKALSLAPNVPSDAHVLDIACGPGAQTLDLAALMPMATINAIDAHAAYVEEAQRRVIAAELSDRVHVTQADMRSLPFEVDSFDLIWCEGAAYIMGIKQALSAWRPLLKRGGALAFSEAVWLRDDPPSDLRDWWAEGYPNMLDVEGCRKLIEECSYRLLGDFVLPESAWWDDYYVPLEKRLKSLVPKYEGSALAMDVLKECQKEIDFFRLFAAFYGYVFLVVTPTS